MTHIAPLPLEAINDPEMLELIAQGKALGVPDDVFPRLIARAPAQAKPMMRAMLMSHMQGNVDHKLKEIVRILLARFANDKYFASLRSRKKLRPLQRPQANDFNVSFSELLMATSPPYDQNGREAVGTEWR